MADNRVPFDRCFMIARQHGAGWIIDVQIDGETISNVYTHGDPITKEGAFQKALHAVRGVIRDARNHRP